MISIPAPAKKSNKLLKLGLKFLLTAACIAFIVYKIDFTNSIAAIRKAHPLWIILSVVFFAVSKVISSFRLNAYFRLINVRLTEWANLKLYWLGMLFNIFLPGSISGDGYKVIRLTKAFDTNYKKTTAAVLLDRFSGLAALGIFSGILWVSILDTHGLTPFIIAGTVLILPVYYLAVKLIFPYLLPAFWRTFFYGIAVQFFQMLSFWCILKALGIHDNTLQYFLIFLVSSVAAVLPLTIGGIGIREFVFLYGAGFFSLGKTLPVTTGMIFYLVNVINAAFGFYFLFADPLQGIDKKSIH